TTTISREQREYAEARVRAAGVEGLVTVLGSDYRDLEGRYDKLVSIEMIEAVGWEYFDTFFEQCSNLLEPHGLFFLPAITTHDRRSRLRGAEARQDDGHGADLPRRMPAFAGGHPTLPRGSDRHAHRVAGGHQPELRLDAAPMAREVRRRGRRARPARLRRAVS